MKHILMLPFILIASSALLHCQVDTGRPCSGMPYDSYLGPMRQTYARLGGGSPSINDVRLLMLTVIAALGSFGPAAVKPNVALIAQALLDESALPELLALLKDPEASVRGAAAIPLRVFMTDDASKQKFREALRPLLEDRDVQVRWAALDTLHEFDPGKDAALVTEIAALLKDVVPADDKARATELLQDALKAPLLHEKLKAEITGRLAELNATP